MEAPTFLGVEKVSGKEAFFAAKGDTCGMELGAGNHEAHLHFPHSADRFFFFRSQGDEEQSSEIITDLQDSADITMLCMLHHKKKSSFRGHFRLQKNARIRMVVIAFAESDADYSFTFEGEGEGSEILVNTLLIGQGKSQVNFSLTSSAKASRIKSQLRMFSALFDESNLSLHGIPEVEKGAKGCVTHLEQQSFLFGKKTRLQAVPFLNISNDDVISSHKSSIFHFEEEDLFYLKNRGLSGEQAREILLEGILIDILSPLPDNPLKNGVYEKAHHFFQKL